MSITKFGQITVEVVRVRPISLIALETLSGDATHAELRACAQRVAGSGRVQLGVVLDGARECFALLGDDAAAEGLAGSQVIGIARPRTFAAALVLQAAGISF
jgi:hypothetical protein